MNRHDRRREQAEGRKRGNNSLARYVQRFPMIPAEEYRPENFLGRVVHKVMRHDNWCGIYKKKNGSELDCDCNPIVSYHLQPLDLEKP